MAITLNRLCENVEKTYGMKLIAGAAGMDNFVRWVHMVEDREVAGFLHGNELIFTTGIAQTGGDWLLEFATNMHRRSAIGLVVNIGPYIRSVPPKVISFCEEQGMPLFTVPWEIHLIDITHDFCRRIVASEEVEINLATAVKNLIFEPHDEKAYKYTLERRSFHTEAVYCVVALQPELDKEILDENEMRNLRLQAHRLLNKTGKLFSVFFHERKLIAVLQNFSTQQIEKFIDMLQHNFTEQHARRRMPAGVSPMGAGYGYISGGYHKANAALKVAAAHKKSLMHYDELGIYKLLISVENPQVLQDFFNESLGPLAEFDQSSGTDYLDTLRCYLEHDSSVQEVAAITYVHRNTINYKIKRIREILNCSLGQEDRLKFMLAFFARDLL